MRPRNQLIVVAFFTVFGPISDCYVTDIAIIAAILSTIRFIDFYLKSAPFHKEITLIFGPEKEEKFTICLGFWYLV